MLMLEGIVGAGGLVGLVGGIWAMRQWIIPGCRVGARVIRGLIVEFVPSDPKTNNDPVRDQLAQINDTCARNLHISTQTFEQQALLKNQQDALHGRQDATVALIEAHIAEARPVHLAVKKLFVERAARGETDLLAEAEAEIQASPPLVQMNGRDLGRKEERTKTYAVGALVDEAIIVHDKVDPKK